MFFSLLYRLRLPIALALGAIDAWAGRGSFMAGDTISYMDMARGIASGDLNSVINGYWSPLYPLLLAPFVQPYLHDTAAQFTAVRLANFLIFIATTIAFEFFLRQLAARNASFISERTEHCRPLPYRMFVVAGYATFVWASIGLNMVSRISPDNAVLLFVLLDAMMILSLESGSYLRPRFIGFGVLLGIGYWLKAFLLPAGLALLAIAFITHSLRGRKRFLLWTTLSFALSALPLIVLTSMYCGRPTFGETGRLNYAWHVNHVQSFTHWQGGAPGQGEPLNPTRLLHKNPEVFEFSTPFETTYPPWSDPSYWYRGVETHFEPTEQAIVILKNCYRIAAMPVAMAFLTPLLLFTAAMAWQKQLCRVESRQAFTALVTVVGFALVYIALYTFVFVEQRYICGPYLLLTVALISSIRLSSTRSHALLLILVVAASAISVSPRIVRAIIRVSKQDGNSHDHRWKVSEEFSRIGVAHGTPVGSIGTVAFSDWAYIAQVRVITEITDYRSGNGSSTFWSLSTSEQNQILDRMRTTGAKLIVCDASYATDTPTGWTRIPNSNYLYIDWR